MRTGKVILAVAVLLLLSTSGQAAIKTLLSSQDVGYASDSAGTVSVGKYGYMNADKFGTRRMLIQWDLAEIVVQEGYRVNVTSAVARIYIQTANGLENFSVYALSEAWFEGHGMSNGSYPQNMKDAGISPDGANWTYRDIKNGLEWTDAGGTFDVSSRVQYVGWHVPDPQGGVWGHMPDVTAIVQSWVDGTRVNNGLIFLHDGPHDYIMACKTRDYGYPDDGQDRPGPGWQAPELEITYTLDAIPEPATMGLLVAGGIATLLRRRRRA